MLERTRREHAMRDPAAEPHIAPSAQQLDRDAVEIGDLYRKAKQSIIDSVRYQIECGHRLAAKKDEVGHGRWLPWLAANADVLGFENRTTASRLIKLANDASTHHWDDLDVAQARQISRRLWNNDIAAGWGNSGNAEWFTETKYLQLARTVLGAIDLDPASCAAAQRRVRAEKFFTKFDDGLSKEWYGRAWLNPPFSRPLIKRFTDKLLEEHAAGRVSAAIMLTNAYTSNKWFQKAGLAATAICFTKGRSLKFVDANGTLSNPPTQGQAFFYFGRRLQLFARTFSNVGFIVARP
jgi:hypothetical protein